IQLITECMTLEPGDVVITGTPAGVGYARTPPVFMKPGDVCEIEIERIGVLQNSIKDQSL
ncbi:MAG: 5-oxopent-3-ene-1,2,5-tricarboxylate decarboxylase, partial [Burkholderiaceae bacterium]|nr:5-oxopent-3-ene-1,2,5-tricarboxylate decarboxylase [Burkholderiaceae bacterium]